MDFAQMPYAVRTDASLSGIKCYLCCRLQYAYRFCLFPLCLCCSPYIFLFTLYCHPSPLPVSPGKESVALKSTFQKFLLLFANNVNILFKELLSCSCVVVNISFFSTVLSLIARWQYSQGSLLVVSVQKARTAASNDKRCMLVRWVHFKCRVMFQAAQQRSCASYGLIRKA